MSDYDDVDNSDIFTASELYEMDRADEFRLDAADDARNAEREADEHHHGDDQPWAGLADGEER